MSESTIYNKIGRGYNTTRKADPYIAGRLYALLQPEASREYIDIGCGTGNYTVKLAEMGLNITGIDPSELMLKEAMQKSSQVNWMKGMAENIPMADSSVDGVIATLTMHHWKDTAKAFSELARVMKQGAKMVIFTFTPEQESGYWFNHFFPEMMRRGMEKSMALDNIKEIAEDNGFEISEIEKYYVQDDLEDMFGYSGKNDPERYFDPVIINGISYFNIYSTQEETTLGLAELRKSINDGSFKKIKEQYDTGSGDYLFVVLKKSRTEQ